MWTVFAICVIVELYIRDIQKPVCDTNSESVLNFNVVRLECCFNPGNMPKSRSFW